MHGELSSEDKAAVKEHLDSCSKCLSEFEEYSQIQMAAQGEVLPEVSPEVLAKISEAANEDLKNKRRPFWKKWSYSPILVPALTTAIALSVWFYYGYDGVNISPEVASKKREMAYQTQAESVEPESRSMGAIVDDNPVMDHAVVLEQQIDSPEEGPVSQPAEKPQSFAYEELPASPADSEISSSSQFAEESDSANLRSQKEPLSMAAQKQKEDRCDVSIRANEAIVNSTTPPSKSAQKKSYKLLAECYEQKGDFDNAISNYIKLEQVAPEESAFANSRIEEIRNRVELDHEQQRKLSDPVPAN